MPLFMFPVLYIEKLKIVTRRRLKSGMETCFMLEPVSFIIVYYLIACKLCCGIYCMRNDVNKLTVAQ